MTTPLLTTTPTPTTRRAATAAMAGGVLWALLPAAMSIAPLQSTPRGTLEFAAVVAVAFLCGVASLALLLVALPGTRTALGPGRLTTAAVALCAPGLAAMLIGNGTELTTLTVAGQENDLGHSVFLVGVLVLLIGELLLGIAVLRRRRDRAARAAGIVLVLAVPLGIAVGLLLNLAAPHTDAGFWAALSVPTGIAWLLLGRALLPRTTERTAIA